MSKFFLQKQCLNYQKFDHSTKIYFAQSIYQICAEKHNTSQHNCNICNIQDQICSHAVLKCSNCEENHTANSNTYEFKINIKNKSTKYSQNMQKKKQTKNQFFQV